jgi:hypothetical protein
MPTFNKSHTKVLHRFCDRKGQFCFRYFPRDNSIKKKDSVPPPVLQKLAAYRNPLIMADVEEVTVKELTP